MSDELEFIGAASIGAVARDTTGDGYLNGPCPNCGTEIDGNFCAECGQSTKDLKKPFISLFRDMLGDVFSFDGRLFRTIPALLFRPGRITRAYIDGKRMRYVPPFRLFLIASVLFFLVLFNITEKQSWIQGDDLNITANGIRAANLIIDDKPIEEYEGFDDLFDEDGNLVRDAAEEFIKQLEADGALDEGDLDSETLLDSLEVFSGEGLSRSELLRTIQKWVPRLSFLLLPSFVITLTILHFWIRRIYIYDHVIVALHMQSFFYLFATIGMLLPMVHPGIVWGVFGVVTFIYPFLQMRRAYDTNWFFNLFRVFGLYISSLFAFIGLVILIAFATASDLGLIDRSDIEGLLEDFSEQVGDGVSEPPTIPDVPGG